MVSRRRSWEFPSFLPEKIKREERNFTQFVCSTTRNAAKERTCKNNVYCIFSIPPRSLTLSRPVLFLMRRALIWNFNWNLDRFYANARRMPGICAKCTLSTSSSEWVNWNWAEFFLSAIFYRLMEIFFVEMHSGILLIIGFLWVLNLQVIQQFHITLASLSTHVLCKFYKIIL